MKNTQGFVVDSVLVCDDIRREDTGKAILIGVYVGDIILLRAPAVIPVSVFVTGSATRDYLRDLKVNVHIGDEPKNEGPTFPMTVSLDDQGRFYFAMTGMPVQVSEPTSLTVRTKHGQNDWVVLAKKRILVNASEPSANESSPPS
jgi:hypothetical protein